MIIHLVFILKMQECYMDEILMRQGSLNPTTVSAKYQENEAMQQKTLLQELINNKNNKQYEQILKTQRVYNRISPEF